MNYRNPLLLCVLFVVACSQEPQSESSASAPSSSGAPVSTKTADVIFHNAKIYTVDESRSWAQALAVKDGVIQTVGLTEDVMAYKGDATTVVDVGGRMVMPGIVDVHTHYELGGLTGVQCWLPNTFENPTIDDVIAGIKECDKRFPGNGWLYGNSFHANAIPPELYNSKWLDTIVADRPAQMLDEPGHGYLLNSKALEIIREKNGVTDDTQSPEGGVVGKYADGTLNGVFRSTARKFLIEEPAPSYDDKVEAYTWAIQELYKHGTTAIMNPFSGSHMADNWWDGDLRAWKEAWNATSVQPRMDLCLFFGDGSYEPPSASRVLEVWDEANMPEEIKLCAKIYGDGVLEGGTAALVENYANRDHNGSLGFAPAELQALVTDIDAAGIPIKVHAIGDRTVREVLNAYELVIEKRGGNPLRHHIAHITSVHPDDWSRFRRLDVPAEFIGSVAALIPYVEKGYYPALGHDRFHLEMEPSGGILREGAVVAAVSDWGAALLDSMRSIQTVITRKDPNNQDSEVAGPMHRLDLPTAIAVHTINGAFIMRRENEIGSLEVGKQADLIVLDQNLFEIPEDTIRDTRVLLTVIGGKKAWEPDGESWNLD